jgi:hypothetical protein
MNVARKPAKAASNFTVRSMLPGMRGVDSFKPCISAYEVTFENAGFGIFCGPWGAGFSRFFEHIMKTKNRSSEAP